MGDDESRQDDYKRERWELAHPEEVTPDLDPCPCHDGEIIGWVLVNTTTYGDDADGRRGVPLWIYECSGCGEEKGVRRWR